MGWGLYAPRYVVPPNQNFFGSLEHNFGEVKISEDGQVSTEEFLAAAKAFSNFFSVYQSVTFTRVYYDVTGNIKKLEAFYQLDKTGRSTLDKLIDAAMKAQEKEPRNGLYYLFITLENATYAVAVFLANISDSPQGQDIELAKAFPYAYDRTLWRWHSDAMKAATKLGYRTIPYTKDFLKMLGSDKVQLKKDGFKWHADADKVFKALEPAAERAGVSIGEKKTVPKKLVPEDLKIKDPMRTHAQEIAALQGESK